MSDIVVVAANVAIVTDGTKGVPTTVAPCVAAATVLVGQSVYRDSTGRVRPCNVTDAQGSNVIGICVSGGSANQEVGIAVAGDVNMGALLTSGVPANVGVGAGGITITGADVTTSWYPALIGVCMSTTNLRILCGGGQGNEGFNHA